MSVTDQDAIQVLTADHQAVEQLFSQLESMPPGPARDEVVQQVTRELSIHAAIEEQVLYPAMRKALENGDELVDEANAEHQEVKEILAALEETESAAQDPLLKQLIASVRHHVTEEENELFPKLRVSIGREGGLIEMGEKLQAAKKGAPTHPHPHAPSKGPGAVVGGAAAGLVDKVRDKLGDD